MAEAETNVLNIVGEQVTLTETTFPLKESFIVQFDPYYKFPGITPDEEIKLKKALQSVFAQPSYPALNGQKIAVCSLDLSAA
jgi:hypothetical protein